MGYSELSFVNLTDYTIRPVPILRVNPTEDRAPRRVIEALTQGAVVAFPTDTVYGIGCRIDDEGAVRRLYEIKSRPLTEPLPILLADLGQLPDYVTTVPEIARTLIRQFWPGPLTLVLPRSPRVPALVAGGGPTVAVRLPRHPIPRALARGVGVPIVGTSANSHGRPTPVTAQHVLFDLGDRIDFVLDGGRTSLEIESTVIEVTGPMVRILRHGAIPDEALVTAAGPVTIGSRGT
jgi:L-threonylcarbamoyladenylate synthase